MSARQDLNVTTGQQVANLEVFAESNYLWTGITAASDGQIFVSYPTVFSAPSTLTRGYHIGLVTEHGETGPFPNHDINTWIGRIKPPEYPNLTWAEIIAREKICPQTHFICIQSIVVDDKNNLWVLDPANPGYQGVIQGGAKLVKINLSTKQVEKTIYFDNIPDMSYLNDVRIDTDRHYAYITDSGIIDLNRRGALYVVDLKNDTWKRVLDGHRSTQPIDKDLVVENEVIPDRNGDPLRMGVDGIALSVDKKRLYFHGVNSNELFSVPTDVLCERNEEKIRANVRSEATTGMADGMAMGPDGRLYITILDGNAIDAFHPDECVRNIVTNDLLIWPDSICFSPTNEMLVTVSHINRVGKPSFKPKILKIN